MKLNDNAALVCIYALMIISIIAITWISKTDKPVEQASSFVGYSQSCWQVGDTLHVVTAKGDTIRLDVSRLEGDR